MVDPVHIFDRKLMAQRRARAAACFDDYDFLFKWVAGNIEDRLLDITREFDTVLQIGARGGRLVDRAIVMDVNDAYAPDIIGDEEFLPFGRGACDLILSNLALHSVNDLPGALAQIRRALKPDGLFIGAMLGGESLFELRDSLNAAEMAVKGGLSPRVSPFADKQDLGALLQRGGFALPVIDSDIITVTYDNMFALMADLRGMGESNIIAARDKRNPGKAFFMEAAKHYAENFSEPDERIAASFEVIFLLGWAPHESQQKPLKPGSAETHLSEVL